MRRRLLLVVVATTSLVVVAFAVPLGALVRSVARDRALSAAERDLGALAPVLALSPDAGVAEDAMARTGAGADGRLTVWLPDGTRLGDTTPDDQQALALARGQRRSFSQDRDGARELYTVVVTGTGETGGTGGAGDVSVVRARVPDDLLDDGVATAWGALAGVAVALIVAAALIADRLARSVTRDATGLSATARALASGTTEARAQPGPTPELAAAARARATHWSVLADDDRRAWTLDVEPDGAAPVRLPVQDAEAAIDALIGNVFAHTPEGSAYAVTLRRHGGTVAIERSPLGGARVRLAMPIAAGGAVRLG